MMVTKHFQYFTLFLLKTEIDSNGHCVLTVYCVPGAVLSALQKYLFCFSQ